MPVPDSLDRRRAEIHLATSQLCVGLDEHSVAEIAQLVRPLTVSAGEVIWSQGDVVDCIIIVGSGLVKAQLVDQHQDQRVLGFIRPGEHFGEVPVFKQTQAPSTMMAVFDSELWALPSNCLDSLISRWPAVTRNLLRNISVKLLTVAGLERSVPTHRFIAWVTSTPRDSDLARKLTSELVNLGERISWFHLVEQNSEYQPRPEHPLGRVVGSFADCFEQCEAALRTNSRVFVEIIGTSWNLSDRLLALMKRVDCLLVPLESRDEQQSIRLLDEIVERIPAARSRVYPVWLLSPDTPVAPKIPERVASLGRSIKVPLTDYGCSQLQEEQGLTRLTRLVRGLRFGIAFGGGGARGMAHLGVLKAFDRAGIYFDDMAGTSCGALSGIPYAAGLTPEFCIDSFARDLTPGWIYRVLPGGNQLFLLAKFRTRAWDWMLRKYLHDWHLQQLPVTFRAVSVDLVAAETVIRDEGDAVHALLESINLPGIAAPVLRDGRVLVDGGVLNNLPADVLVQCGADFVVAVDVVRQLKAEFAGNRPEMGRRDMRHPGMVETLFRIFETQGRGLTGQQRSAADIVIEPDTSGFGFADFSSAAGIAAVGELATEMVLPQIRERIKKLEESVTSSVQPRF